MTMTEEQTSNVMMLSIDETQSFVAGVKAVAIGASTDRTRSVLTSVLIIVGDGEIKMVTTDSYRMHVVTLGPYIDMPAEFKYEFMIDVKQLVSSLPKSKQPMSLKFDHHELILKSSDGPAFVLQYQRGTFPAWRNLIKEDKPQLPFTIGLNPKLVAEINKAADIFRGKTDAPIRFSTGNTEMQPCHWDLNVVDRGTFYALLKPVRLS